MGRTKRTGLQLDPKQARFVQNYLDPMSPTYANIYQSGLSAGYSPSYSQSIMALNPKWIQDLKDKVIPSEVEIIQGIKAETTYGLKEGEKNTAMSAQTRLKAYELLGKTRKIDIFADGRANNSFTGDIHITLGTQAGNTEDPNKAIIDI